MMFLYLIDGLVSLLYIKPHHIGSQERFWDKPRGKMWNQSPKDSSLLFSAIFHHCWSHVPLPTGSKKKTQTTVGKFKRLIKKVECNGREQLRSLESAVTTGEESLSGRRGNGNCLGESKKI